MLNMTPLNMKLLLYPKSDHSQYFESILTCTNSLILNQKLTVPSLSYWDRIRYFVQMQILYVEILMWDLDQINSTIIEVYSSFLSVQHTEC